MSDQREKDFELCQDFGLSDQVRAGIGAQSTERLQCIKKELNAYIEFGVMAFSPAMIPVFALARGEQHAAEVIRDTLISILKERGA